MSNHKITTDLLKIFIRSLLNGRKHGKTTPKILVIYGGVIGDGILFFDALKAMTQFYTKQGKELTLLCNTAVESFLKEIRRDITVKIASYDMHRIISDYKYFRSITDPLDIEGYELIIKPLHSKRADLLALNIRAEEKLSFGIKIRSKISSAFWLDKLVYSKHFFTAPDEMLLKSYKKLLHYIGDNEYRASITQFAQRGTAYDFKRHEPYCVIFPTARETEKCWDIRKLCKVIDYITDTFDLNIYICSDSETVELFNQIAASVKQPSRLRDYAGKTSLADWVELVRNARFCFGNDSASVHIAARTGTKYFAVTPGIYYGGTLPYDLDIITDDDVLPVVITKTMPCFGCYAIDTKRCAGNKSCKRNVKKNGRFLCIENISADDAIEVMEVELSLDFEKGRGL